MRAIILFLLLLSGLTAGTAGAEPACAQHLRLAMSAMPDAKLADDTPFKHVVDDLVPELERRSGATIDYAVMPRVRAFTELRSGQIDMVPLATRSAERDSYAQMLMMGHMKAQLMVRKTLKSKPQSAAELLADDIHVLLVRGQDFGPSAAHLEAALAKQGRLEVVGDQSAAARMLKAGRADAILGMPAFFDPALDANEMTGATDVIDGDFADALEEGFYVNDHVSAACMQHLRSAAEDIYKSDLYHELLERYLTPPDRVGFNR